MTDVEIANRATTILRSRGRRDRVRASQVATYRRVLEQDGLPGFITELTEKELWDVATLGWPSLGANGKAIDAQFVAWAHARDFPVKSHIWIKGFLATCLALPRR